MTDVVLAVDIGGTKTAAALVDRDGTLLETTSAPTPGAEGSAAIVATVVAVARELLALAESGTQVRGVGIGTAGVVDTVSGSIISATDTLAGWAGTPLRDLVTQALADVLPAGAPVLVQNDVDAHAYGEFRRGAAAGAQSVLVVAVGTGIGAGIILNGAPHRGARHVAGEFAHLPIPGTEHLMCTCGRPGHLEALGSGLGIHRQYLALGGDATVTDSRGVVARAQAGESVAAQAVEDAARCVGRGIAGAVTLLDPEVVVVTGGVADIGASWWQPMTQTYRAEAIDVLQDVALRPGLLGSSAPLHGAACAVWERLTEES